MAKPPSDTPEPAWIDELREINDHLETIGTALQDLVKLLQRQAKDRDQA